MGETGRPRAGLKASEKGPRSREHVANSRQEDYYTFMLEDRDYMREPEFGDERWRPNFRLRWSWTMIFMAVNLAVFVMAEIAKAYSPGFFFGILEYGALSNQGLLHGYLWQLLTFQFLHFAPWHFIGNMVGLFFIGRLVEDMIGGRRFVILYLLSGFVGGIVQSLLGLAFTMFALPVVGASAGVFGLMAALAVLQPNAEFLVFYILPVKIKYLALVALIVALFYTIVPAEPGIAHAAHLGGMAMGWFYIRKVVRRAAWLGVEEDERNGAAQAARPERTELDEGDVDAVLDKISARGINSLTARERAILEAARKRMAQR